MADADEKDHGTNNWDDHLARELPALEREVEILKRALEQAASTPTSGYRDRLARDLHSAEANVARQKASIRKMRSGSAPPHLQSN